MAFPCRMNPMAASMGLKADASSKEIEEAMKRVREAQSLISAAIEPGSEHFVLKRRTLVFVSSISCLMSSLISFM